MSLKIRLAGRGLLPASVSTLMVLALGAACGGPTPPPTTSGAAAAITTEPKQAEIPVTRDPAPSAALPPSEVPAPASTSTPAASSVPSNALRIPSQTETRTMIVPGERSEAPKRPGLTVPETRTTEVIQATVAQNRLSVRACYEKALAAEPKLRGTLTIHFSIDPDGHVTSAEVNVQRTTLSNQAVAECALAAVKKIVFPKSSRGFESTVNYPFDFRPSY